MRPKCVQSMDEDLKAMEVCTALLDVVRAIRSGPEIMHFIASYFIALMSDVIG